VRALPIDLAAELVYALEEGEEATMYTFWSFLGKPPYNVGIDTEAFYHDLFLTACQDGLTTIAQWMLCTGTVDVSANDYMCFVYACWHDTSLKTAHWLGTTFNPSETARQRAFEESKNDDTKTWLAGGLGGFRVATDSPFRLHYTGRLMRLWSSIVLVKRWFRRVLHAKRSVWYRPDGVFGVKVIDRLIAM